MENKYTNVYIAEGARIVGDVTIGEGSSVWYNAVVRGDSAGVRIGKRTNVQDLACIHEDTGHPAVIGDDVTIGHGAIVHGCTVEGNAIIGMGAKIVPAVNSVWTFCLFCVGPFNLFKGLVISLITFLLYKRVSPLIHSFRDKERKTKTE